MNSWDFKFSVIALKNGYYYSLVNSEIAIIFFSCHAHFGTRAAGIL